MMKKVGVGIALVVIMLSVVIYNHLQQPNNKDVFNITKTWSPATEEVILIREIDGQWLTIFRNQNGFMITELQQNWLGTWKFGKKFVWNDIISTYKKTQQAGSSPLTVLFSLHLLPRLFLQSSSSICLLPWQINVCTAKVTVSSCLLINWTT